MSNTLVVNLYGGPGSGKSTAAAEVFAQLKATGVECEMALEKAKDFVYESPQTLGDQLYISGLQWHRIYRMLGKTQVIVTDSPILMGAVYCGEAYQKRLVDLLQVINSGTNRLNFFLERRWGYVKTGRVHSESEALEVDGSILKLLDKIKEPYDFVSRTDRPVTNILDKVMGSLA